MARSSIDCWRTRRRWLPYPGGGIVHRLDKDTSGVMLAARSSLSHQSLVRQLSDRSASRRYCAVCRGSFTGGGSITEPIGRHPTSRIKMAVVPDGKPAITHYRIAQRFGAHTQLDVSLESGRTHQIRVHFAWCKRPLVGDPVYGGRATRLRERASGCWQLWRGSPGRHYTRKSSRLSTLNLASA